MAGIFRSVATQSRCPLVSVMAWRSPLPSGWTVPLATFGGADEEVDVKLLRPFPQEMK